MSEYRDPDALAAKAKGGDPRQDQHFLVDDRVLDRLPSYLSVAPGHVLEVGAGTGALTDRLLSVADHVTAVERDRELAEFLRTEFADAITADRLTVLAGDALAVSLPEYDSCVSNLPYGISSEITFRLLPHRRPAVLTYQREFAERMVATAGTPEYGRLSVMTRQYADPEIVEIIPPEAFDPQPAVDSAVVRLEPRTPEYETSDPLFADLVKGMFTQRRKTVRNAIRNTGHISGLADPDAVVAAIDEAVLSQRPGDLEPATFARIARTAAEVSGRE
ncbi:MAG: 16S rRNA (adenine(1518)-N(6)/adenine(1519)-N(6))-dimethyltransferase RsmA [Halobacteriaceae archaeon]